ncbi:MAG: hypothetical protein K2Q20_07430, partial [Phycisphaerales bacterium]|nr:hypothetical protein [Phycisphaerales bacterium]
MPRFAPIALSLLLAAAKTTLAQCPEPPANVTAAISACSRVITWTSGASPLFFQVLRSESAIDTATVVG